MNETLSADRSPALPVVNMLYRESMPVMIEQEELPEWKVSGIFSSHMVLQRDCPITVWGWSKHIGAKVSAFWDDENVISEVKADGRFEVTFSPRSASFAPSRMVIASDYGKDIFTDILVGDVWLIGGQSNAELNLEPCLIDTPEIAEDLNEELPFRLFTQTQAAAYECTKYYFTPSRDIICPDWRWKKPGAEAAKTFSAIGYYFARTVSEKAGIPIGAIMMCAGGACLRELMPYELACRQGCMIGANIPAGGYYNTLIAPLIGYMFKGQIFFQGESEGIAPTKELALSYDTDLAAFVEDERRRFGVDFCFYNIQLSSYRQSGIEHFPHLYWVRSRQLRSLDLIPNSHLIVSRDHGSGENDADPIHSPHKYATAQRVAALALACEYGIGETEAANSPIPIEAVRTNDQVTVKFKYTNGGLITAQGESLVGFSFMDEVGAEVAVTAEISSSDTVCVSLPKDLDISEIHFAMDNIATMKEANLCGGNGLPVPAFAINIT